MGTNYYWEKDGQVQSSPVTDHSEKSERLHIGKSSVGWNFLLNGADDFTSWKEWKNHLSTAGGQIIDEYGTVQSLDEFIALVESKSNNPDLRTGDIDSDLVLDLDGYRISRRTFR